MAAANLNRVCFITGKVAFPPHPDCFADTGNDDQLCSFTIIRIVMRGMVAFPLT